MRASVIVVMLALLVACEREPAAPETVRAAPALTPADIAANNRGVALMGYFDYGGARETFAELVERRPAWLEAQVNLAISTLNRQQEGDEARALEIVASVLERDPAHVRAHYVSGLLNLYLGETGTAEMHFARVVAARPDDAYANYYLGQVLMQAGRVEEAVEHYRRAMALDPYLRSAYYGAALALRRSGEGEEARELLAAYQRFEDNPRARLAEFKYTRMGPLGEALAVGEPARARATVRPGAAFGAAQTIAELAGVATGSTLTTVDIDRDGDQELFVTRVAPSGGNALLMRDEAADWRIIEHPLNAVSDVNAVAWGDIDNDGRVDAYLCRAGANQLWRQAEGDGVMAVASGTRAADDTVADASAPRAAGNIVADASKSRAGDATAYASAPQAAGDAVADESVRVGESAVDAARGTAVAADAQLAATRNAPQWQDITAATGTGNDAADCADVLFVDADHDGDLDIFVVNRDAPNELYSNNRDGTFRALGTEYGLAGRAGSRNAIATDFDNDRDLDLIVIKDTPPHEVFVNDRLWQYRAETPAADWVGRPIEAAVAADVDADGFNDIVALHAGRAVAWSSATPDWPELGVVAVPGATQLMLGDVDGDGGIDLLARNAGLRLARNPWLAGQATLARTADGEPASEPAAPAAVSNTEAAIELPVQGAQLVAALPLYVAGDKGPAVVALAADGALSLLPPSDERQPFVTLDLTGKEESSESMRSNRDGIGTRVALRVGTDWSIVERIDDNSAPGQSLQPLMIGIGAADKADFVALTWSDGVFQTELALAPGELHRIEETQRQLSSCPVLFAWNGERYTFVTDMLGVAGLGFFVEPGVAATPRPWEFVLLPENALAARDGDYVLKITEPMEEIAYLDSARLHVYDLPPGIELVLDERMVIAGPAATGAPIFYRDEIVPLQAFDSRGNDVTRTVAHADREAAPVGKLDRRFIGRLARPHTLTLDFERPLDSVRPGSSGGRTTASAIEGAAAEAGAGASVGAAVGASAGQPVLIIDGWVEYPYSQTVFAAWQAGAGYEAPTLEAFGADGRWHLVHARFGYPAGMPRRMALPLAGLPRGTMRLRLTTNLEVYYDRIAVAFAHDHQPAHTVLEPVAARQKLIGFPLRTTHAQRRPDYDYERRDTFWDTRYPRGNYSAFGDVSALVAQADDAVAVIGPGEEVELRFAALMRELPPGWQRRYVLEVRGWAKDMDLYTYDGGTVGPLPTRTPDADTRARDALHERYHTRFQSGF